MQIYIRNTSTWFGLLATLLCCGCVDSPLAVDPSNANNNTDLVADNSNVSDLESPSDQLNSDENEQGGTNQDEQDDTVDDGNVISQIVDPLCECLDDTECDDGNSASGKESCVDCLCVESIPPECVDDTDCATADPCESFPQCIEGSCVDAKPNPGYTVDAGQDQTVALQSATELSCTPIGVNPADLISIEWSLSTASQATGSLNDNGDGTATFIPFTYCTAELTCTAVIDDDCISLVSDSVEISVPYFGVDFAFDDKLVSLKNSAFFKTLLSSTDSKEPTAEQPPGLLALVADVICGVSAADFLLSYSCKSGPTASTDCSDATFIVSEILNGTGQVAQYILHQQPTSTITLRNDGSVGELSYWIQPGKWVFNVLATATGKQANETATYTIVPILEVLDPFASEDKELLHGMVAVNSDAIVTGAPGVQQTIQFAMLARYGGVLTAHIETDEGLVKQPEILIDADDSQVQLIDVVVNPPTVPGSYRVLLDWDSELGSAADAQSLDSHISISVIE